MLVDLNEESEGEEQDFDSWEPDPVDADPSECIVLCAMYIQVHVYLSGERGFVTCTNGNCTTSLLVQ